MHASESGERVNVDRKSDLAHLLGEEDGNGSGSSALQLLGSLRPQTPSSTWGSHPVTTRLDPEEHELPGSVLGVEDDLRTLTPRWADEITSPPPLVEGL